MYWNDVMLSILSMTYGDLGRRYSIFSLADTCNLNSFIFINTEYPIIIIYSILSLLCVNRHSNFFYFLLFWAMVLKPFPCTYIPEFSSEFIQLEVKLWSCRISSNIQLPALFPLLHILTKIWYFQSFLIFVNLTDMTCFLLWF